MKAMKKVNVSEVPAEARCSVQGCGAVGEYETEDDGRICHEHLKEKERAAE